MGYTYNINTSKADKKSTIALTLCHLIYTIVNIFITTFLIAHIYSLTSNLYQYAMNVAIYQLSSYVCMFIVYILCSFLVDKTNRVWVYRFANILQAGLVIVTIFYGKDLAKIVVLAGVLKGSAHGAYFASYNVMKQEMVSRKTMDSYAVILMVLTKTINVICPILLGALIEVSTFSMVAIYVLVITVIQIIISFMIKSKRPTNSGFNVIEYFKKLKAKNVVNKKIKLIYLTAMFYGATTVVSTLLSINIMIQFGSNFSLGALTSIVAIFAVITIILTKKFTKSGRRAWVYIGVGIAQIVGALIFVFVPNVVTLIIYNFAVAICEAVIATFFDVIRNKNLKEAGLYEDIAEHQCVIESVLQTTRVVTFSLLILISFLKNYILFEILFIVFIVLNAVALFLMVKYEKEDK